MELLQREVADELGVSAGTVWNWERNRAAPALRFVPGIIEFLGYVPFRSGNSLTEWLKNYRRIFGISQKRLAQTLGIDTATLARWEDGSNTPSPAVIAYLEKLSADDL